VIERFARRRIFVEPEPTVKKNLSLPAIGRPVKTFEYIRRCSLADFVEQLRHRIATLHGERKFGVSTAGFIEPEELGIQNPDARAYGALGYEHLGRALLEIPLPNSQVVFLDYGAGKGRALVCAAAQPFQKVIGVEISAALVAIARQNLAQMKHRRAGQVEVHHSDAAAFPVPEDVNVFFLFNSFIGRTLVEVVERMRQSHVLHPRDLFVIAFNHAEFDHCVRGERWLRKVNENAYRGLYRSV
jgi:16S rRNA G966 N2-methylase RsmD